MAKLKSSRVYGNLTVDDVLLVSTDATITGNLTVLGTTTTVNSTTVTIEGPIVQQGAGANGAALTSDDGKDRGLDLSYYAGGAQLEAFMGWNTANSEFAFGDNVTISGDVVSFNTYGNIRALHYIGEGDTLGNITGANVTGWVKQANYANYAGNVVNASQPNITSVGNLSGLQIGNASTTGNVVIDTNGNITATGSIIANGAQSNLTIGTALANNSQANIYGNLYVTGTISGSINATIEAKGSSWDVQYKDNTGNLAGSDAFKFDASSSNTVTIGTGFTFVGDTGNANVANSITFQNGGVVGANVQGSGNGVDLYAPSGSDYVQLNYDDSVFVWANADQISFDASGSYYANLYTGNGLFEVTNAFSAAGGNLEVDENGNVNAAGYGSFADLYDTNLTANYIVFPDSTGKLKGTAGFAIASNVLSANNFSTTDANIQGNVTLNKTLHTAGNLLTTNSDGNIVDTSITLSSGLLTIGNANVTGTTTTNKLKITGLNSNSPVSGGILTTDNTGNVTESTDFTYTASTLFTPNANVSGQVTASNVAVNTISQTQVVFAGAGGLLEGDANITYTIGNSTLEVNNINSTGIVYGNVLQTNLSANVVPVLDNNGNLTSDAGLAYYVGNTTLVANNIVGTTTIKSANIFDTDLALHSVVIAGTNGQLMDDTAGGFAYYTGNATLTSNNVIVSADLTSGNVYANTGNIKAGNIISDNLLYANGNPWDFAKANGSATDIQFKSSTGDLQGSSNFTFDPATSLLTVTGNATVTGNLSANNANLTTDLYVGGNANIIGYVKAGDTTITGNLVVTGTTTSVNTTTTQLEDPLIDLGLGANGAALTNDDGKDRGAILHTYNGATSAKNDIFMGWKDSEGYFVLAQNVTVTNSVVDYGSTDADKQANLADLHLGNIYAYNANFGGAVFSNGNITLGSGSFLNGDVKGNISGNIKVAGANGSIQFASNVIEHLGSDVTAGNFVVGQHYKIDVPGSTDFTLIGATNSSSGTYFTATGVGAGTGTAKPSNTYGDLANDGANLEYVAGTLTVSYAGAGTVVADLLTGTLTTTAQPNISSVGTLTSLSTSGNISIDNSSPTNGLLTDNLYYANGNPWDFMTAAGSTGQLQYHGSGTDLAASANLTYDDGTQTLTVVGNIVTGAGSGGNITGANEIHANYFYGDGSNLTNVTAEFVAAANLTGGTLSSNVTSSSLTTVGTLISLEVTGDITSDTGNITATTGNVVVTAGSVNVALGDVNVTSGNVSANNITSNALTSTGIVYTNGSNTLVTDAMNFSYTAGSGTLSVANANVTSNLTVTGNIIDGGLSTNQIAYTASGNVITGDTNFTYDGANLKVGTNISANVSTGAIVAANVTSNNVTATQVVYGDTGGKLTSDSGFKYYTGNSTMVANNFIASSSANLGAIGNVTITGGSDGQYLVANGSSGGLKWASVDAAKISNGTSSVDIPVTNGNIQLTSAGNLVVEVTGLGANVTGYVTVDGDIQGNNITATANITAEGTTDATNAVTGTITTAGGISAQGNIYTGHAIGFANTPGANTDSAAYIQFNATANSLDFIFN